MNNKIKDSINEIKIDPYMQSRLQVKLEKKQKKGYLILVPMLCLMMICGSFVLNNQPIILNSEGLVTFTSVGQLKSYMKANNKEIFYNKEMSIEDVVETNSGTSDESRFGHTYLQEDGVDESDILKNDGKYIYHAFDNIVKIYDKDAKLVNTIQLKNSFIGDLYLYNNQLIVLSSLMFRNYSLLDQNKCNVDVYDISDINNIKLTSSCNQTGGYNTSRRIGNKLYVVTNEYQFNIKNYPSINGKEMPLDCIYGCPETINNSYIIVSEIDLDYKCKVIDSKSILGIGSNIYCNQDSLYLYTSVYEKNKVSIYEMNMSTRIIKVDLKDHINIKNTVKLKGEIHDQYALSEKDGFLRVAVTENMNSHLLIYDKDLNLVSSLKNIAKNEEIKAVRYIDDIAYIITYERTDPLFTINLKDPKNPKILGEVKIDGFSSVLIPVKDRILGIGYDTKYDLEIDMEKTLGLKLVLFDVTDLSKPKVLDTKVYKDTFSSAQHMLKAVSIYHDDFLIPYTDHLAGGLLQISINQDQLNIKIKFKSKLTDVERVTYIDNTGYCIGYDGIDLVKLN